MATFCALEANYDSHPDPFNLKSYLKSNADTRLMPKNLQHFYKKQNELIHSFLNNDLVQDDEETSLIEYKIAMYGSLMANIALFALQLTAAVFSGSLALFATTVDAFMVSINNKDLASNLVLLYAGFLASKHNYITHPTGKNRYKTAGIIVFAVLMSTLSIQIFIESLKQFVQGENSLSINYITYVILGLALCIYS